jgi:osmotically-inducible protein OsmY
MLVARLACISLDCPQEVPRMQRIRLLLATGALVLPIAFAHQIIAADNNPTKDKTGAAAVDVDNTKRNARDADGTTLTPFDQGESQADRTITQQIRKAVVSHDGLSTNAKNVKIITQDGVVTLRGPVKSSEEKSTIVSVAQKTGGVKRVDNQLEIERN